MISIELVPDDELLIEETTRIKIKGMTRDDWLAERRTGIGGSDAGGVMKMSKWSSWLSIYADKKGLTPSKEANEDMDFGNLMEPVIRGWVRGVLKSEGIEARIEKPGFMYRSKRWPWAIANLDGRIYTPDNGSGVLEIKTADRSQTKEWKEGELPGHVLRAGPALYGRPWRPVDSLCLPPWKAPHSSYCPPK